MSKQSLSYKDAGVDINAGNTLVERIKSDVKRTTRPEVIGGLGASVHYVHCQVNIRILFLYPELMVLGLSYALRLT